MVSTTQQTDRRRRIRLAKAGRAKKHQRDKHGTPAFPIQPEGYDPNAADAKPSKAS